VGLFDKRKDKGLTEEQSELFRRLENEFNAFGANLHFLKKPMLARREV
jgi:hypothetical protein